MVAFSVLMDPTEVLDRNIHTTAAISFFVCLLIVEYWYSILEFFLRKQNGTISTSYNISITLRLVCVICTTILVIIGICIGIFIPGSSDKAVPFLEW